MENIVNQKVADIVLRNSQAAAVFDSLYIDYCCKGKMTLAEACIENDIDSTKVVELLSGISTVNDSFSQIMSNPDLGKVIDYIFENHHSFVRNQIPVIKEHMLKVVAKHGSDNPFLKSIERLFNELAIDLEQHLLKEEHILFPHIKFVSEVYNKNIPDARVKYFLRQPVKMMELEHDRAGAMMDEIRKISNNFCPPDSACTTFRLLYKELEEFEKDLHHHVFLENNVLFPKSIEMEAVVFKDLNLL